MPVLKTAADVSCPAIPGKVAGLPMLAALAQGIPVIAAGENGHILSGAVSGIDHSD